MPEKCIAITGATGYIGAILVQRFRQSGYSVKALSRNRPDDVSLEHISYNLEQPLAEAALANVDTIIHLAANTAPVGTAVSEMEVEAAKSLLAKSKRRGVRFIFVSSQTAHADSPTTYGKTKWIIEQETTAAGGIVVRPGQVYGGIEKGLFGMICQLVRTLPILPAFHPPPRVQPIHVNDLAEGLLRLATVESLELAYYNLAAPKPLSFTAFLRTIARWRLRKTRLFFPLPMNFSIVILKFGERLFHRRSDSTRLQSLRDLEPMETQNDLASLGLKLRPLREGIVRSGQGRRRVLLVEGQILLAYLLRRPAPTSVLRRYVRAAEQLPKNLKGQPLNLPCWCQLFPSTLALLEGREKECNQAAEEALISRLNIAVFLAEASPDSADRFLLLGAGRRPVAALFSLFRAGFGELVYRLLRFILNPVRHRALGAITENNP